MIPVFPPPRLHRGHPVLLLAWLTLVVTPWPAHAKPPKSDISDSKRHDKPEAKGGRSNSGDAELRAMTKLREYLEIADDAEWEVIAERINKVNEARNSLGTSHAALRGNPALGDKGKAGARAGASAHPEQDALRSAVRDKLPDAEIKARLARAHEIFQQNEARLVRAQAELRAILTVRQEAVAVMAGLLPP